MNFGYSDEQEAFRRSLRRFLEEQASSDDVRAQAETAAGYDPGLWRRMTGDLGLARGGLGRRAHHGRDVALGCRQIGQEQVVIPQIALANGGLPF